MTVDNAPADPQPAPAPVTEGRGEDREECSCVDCFAPGGCQWQPGPAPGKGRDDPEWEEPDLY
jgi:hypothetical protein